MTSSGAARILRLATAAVLTFLYLPLVIIAIYAFNESRIQAWPPSGFTLHWFGEAMADPRVTQALVNSIIVATIVTAIALVLGTLASLAVQRYDFFGRETHLLLPRSADRPAGRRDRDRAAHVVRHVRRRIRPPDDRHRPRDLLCRHRLQQRHRPAPTPAPLTGGSVRRPRRRRVHDISTSDTAEHGHGPFVRWPARLCTPFDEIIVTNFTAGAGTQTVPMRIYLRHPAPGRAAGRQRRGTRPHPRVGHPCLHRDAPVLGAASARL